MRLGKFYNFKILFINIILIQSLDTSFIIYYKRFIKDK